MVDEAGADLKNVEQEIHAHARKWQREEIQKLQRGEAGCVAISKRKMEDIRAAIDSEHKRARARGGEERSRHFET